MATMKLVVTGFAMLGVLGAIGCGAPTAPEKSGSSSQKLLAPRPLVRTGASPKTRSTLGIYEWRIYKGATDFVITGYDRNKHPVQGYSLAFTGKRSGQKPAVRARMLDGTKASASYDFRAPTVKGTIAAKTKQFLIRAAADFTTVARFAPTAGGVSHKSAGIHILGEAAPLGCARNAGKFIAGGVGCVVGAATAETGAGAVLAGSACYLAADSALDFLSSCYGGDGTKADPNAANTFCDPGGSGFCSSNDTGTSSSGSSGSSGSTSSGGEPDPGTGASSSSSSSSSGASGDPAGDPSGSSQPEDPGEIIKANNDGNQETPDPAEASDKVETASNEGSCDSCQGDSSNLDVNDSNGDVQLASNDTGESSGSETGGDTASDTGGAAGGDVETAAFHRLLGLF